MTCRSDMEKTNTASRQTWVGGWQIFNRDGRLLATYQEKPEHLKSILKAGYIVKKDGRRIKSEQ